MELVLPDQVVLTVDGRVRVHDDKEACCRQTLLVRTTTTKALTALYSKPPALETTFLGIEGLVVDLCTQATALHRTQSGLVYHDNGSATGRRAKPLNRIRRWI